MMLVPADPGRGANGPSPGDRHVDRERERPLAAGSVATASLTAGAGCARAVPVAMTASTRGRRRRIVTSDCTKMASRSRRHCIFAAKSHDSPTPRHECPDRGVVRRAVQQPSAGPSYRGCTPSPRRCARARSSRRCGRVTSGDARPGRLATARRPSGSRSAIRRRASAASPCALRCTAASSIPTEAWPEMPFNCR
jgi:hypothetical protein